MESGQHLFFNCPVARAIWFGCWGRYANKLNLSNNFDIAQVILDPSIQPMPSIHQSKEVVELCTLRMALIVQSIQILRNKIMHDDGQFNITVHICNLKNRVKEFVLALEQSRDLEASKVTSWKPPFVGVIKPPLGNLLCWSYQS